MPKKPDRPKYLDVKPNVAELDLELMGAGRLEERQRLLDDVAIQLFVKGWPSDSIYERAEFFLKLRDEQLKGKP